MKTRHKLSLIVRLNRLLKHSNKEYDIFNEITKIASDTTNSDRSSLYIFDQEKNVLGSKVAQGTTSFIEVPLGTGIAGECARSQKIIIENKAYSNPFFHKEIDLQTGYTTEKILAVPIIGNFNELLGVVQTLNKQDGEYTEEDSEILELIAEIAGSVIENHKMTKILQEQVEEKTKMLKGLNKDLGKIVREQIEEIRIKDDFLFEQSKKAALGDMIGIISHQLKQPLNAIGLTSQMILDMAKNDDLDMQYVLDTQKDVYNYVKFMSSTIDDFRHFFNPNKKKTNFSVRQSIEKVVNIMSIELNKHGIMIDYSHNDVFIDGFDSELQQIFLNLISNSKDAIVSNRSESKHITIKVTSDDKNCIISYNDTGGGID
ncbi:MAG: GAF domain-containing sensor histidine kinase, partial [Campylobacterales bacterium]|nr:GAF domain-containing sensor histidine kinase [Campylobacterales bacterium]